MPNGIAGPPPETTLIFKKGFNMKNQQHKRVALDYPTDLDVVRSTPAQYV